MRCHLRRVQEADHRRELGSEPIGGRLPTPHATSVVRDRTSSNSVEPVDAVGFIRDLVDASPGDEEHVGEDVSSIGWPIDPSHDVAKQPPIGQLVDPGEPKLTG